MKSSLTEYLAAKLTSKKKAKAIAEALSSGALEPEALLDAGPRLLDAELAIVVESFEIATRTEPGLVNDELFAFLVESLGHAAPRVQWEAARTVGNVAEEHAGQLGPAVDALLDNTASDGTVVRWATAQALVAILRAGYAANDFRAKLSEIASTEHDTGVRGVYDKALRARR